MVAKKGMAKRPWGRPRTSQETLDAAREAGLLLRIVHVIRDDISAAGGWRKVNSSREVDDRIARAIEAENKDMRFFVRASATDLRMPARMRWLSSLIDEVWVDMRGLHERDFRPVKLVVRLVKERTGVNLSGGRWRTLAIKNARKDAKGCPADFP